MIDVWGQIQDVNDSRKRKFTTDRAAAGEAAKAGREQRRQETVERYEFLGQPNLRDPTNTITACDSTNDDLSIGNMDTNYV
jgi:hypothetical protein